MNVASWGEGSLPPFIAANFFFFKELNQSEVFGEHIRNGRENKEIKSEIEVKTNTSPPPLPDKR